MILSSMFGLTIAMVVIVLILAARVDALRKWKKQIEGKTEFGDWLLVSKQEWDDFRRYFYEFEYKTLERIRKLEAGVPVNRRAIMPNKWKPWAR